MTPTGRPVVDEPRSAGKGVVRTLGAKVLRLLGRALWRYRFELALAGTALGLLAGAGAAHLVAPQWWWNRELPVRAAR